MPLNLPCLHVYNVTSPSYVDSLMSVATMNYISRKFTRWISVLSYFFAFKLLSKLKYKSLCFLGLALWNNLHRHFPDDNYSKINILLCCGERLMLQRFQINSWTFHDFHFIADIWQGFKWGKVFKSGLSKFCGRQSLKNLKGYGVLKHTISFEIF